MKIPSPTQSLIQRLYIRHRVNAIRAYDEANGILKTMVDDIDEDNSVDMERFAFFLNLKTDMYDLYTARLSSKEKWQLMFVYYIGNIETFFVQLFGWREIE